jgi:hypothetical protein
MGKLKDGVLRISYNLSFIKSTRKVEVYINLNYRSDDGNSSIDDECEMNVLKLNKDTLLDKSYSLGEMILCRVEEKILEYVKEHLKRVLSKIDAESSVDSYSLKYVVRAKVSYNGDECTVKSIDE